MLAIQQHYCENIIIIIIVIIVIIIIIIINCKCVNTLWQCATIQYNTIQ